MSRHRNVRTANYDEDYEGYNDVYGHSLDDDYCVSPSASQYLYDRNKPTQIASFFSSDEAAIVEEDVEDDDASKKLVETTRQRLQSITLEDALVDLAPEEEILLKSCLDEIHNVIGDSVPDPIIIGQILKHKFNVEKALDACLTASVSASHAPEGSTVRGRGREGSSRTGPVGPPAKDFDRFNLGPPPQKQKATVTAAPAFDVVKPSKITASASPFQTRKADSAPVKVVPASKGSVTIGFELPAQREKDNLTPGGSKNNSKTPSPVPGEDSKEEKQKPSKQAKEFKGDTALNEYAKIRGTGKDLLNLLVIGHVDAGKSTLMGHLLWQLGQVSKKTMHKFEQESKKIGKQSFVYAWVLDETGEERSRGITMDVGQSRFETPTKQVVLLDAPGHKDFIPNMITGASQADVSILVVDSTTGEFETGFESGGQTREHAILVRSLGVNQLVIAVNKLDTVNWSQHRFVEIKTKLTSFLVRHAGFRESDLTFVPCSGLVGTNLTKKPDEEALCSWYTGPTLLESIDSFKPPKRPVGKPLRMTVSDVFKGQGGFCVAGRIETGMLQPGDKVLIQPMNETATIKNVTLEEDMGSAGFAGDPVLITLQNLADGTVIGIGDIISDPNFPAKVATKFQATVVTFDTMTIPLIKGFTGVIHLGTTSEQMTVKRLISQLNKGTGEVIKLKPRCLGKNSNGIVEIETVKPVCIEEFRDVKELGRFTLRNGGITVAAGVITQIH